MSLIFPSALQAYLIKYHVQLDSEVIVSLLLIRAVFVAVVKNKKVYFCLCRRCYIKTITNKADKKHNIDIYVLTSFVLYSIVPMQFRKILSSFGSVLSIY